MSQAVIGLVAHVDAGKTTLAEALLYRAGAIRRQGRVDKGDAHLDTDAMERERGITIFSKQTSLDWASAHVMLLDTPGHVDFSAEAERTLQALDYAVLIVGANDGVEGRTETLWSLLARYNVPTFVFVNKLDLAADGLGPVMDEMHRRLSPSVVDGDALSALVASAGGAGKGAAALLEDVAATDEDALDEYLESGSLSAEMIRRLIVQRKVFPCFAGSALRMEGIEEFLDGVVALMQEKAWPDEFAARVYRVSRGAHGERLAWIKVTGGVLRAKEQLSGFDRGAAWNEKVDQVRIYDADSFEIAREVPAGRVCAVTGLSQVLPGSALGAEARLAEPALAPVLSYSVGAAGADATTLVQALRELADEDPLLGVAWHEQLQEVHVQLMGEVQREVVARQLFDRFGLEATFGAGGILYRETVTAPVRGAGHFEPLRHYAEVQLLVEPAERGAGVEAGTRVLEDDLDRNWQRLILTHVLEREHPGMGGEFDAPVAEGDRAASAGSAPASEIGSYALEVSAYSGGRGRLFLEYAGYRPCHNAEQVIADAAYDPVADLANTPDSVFCSHGAGYNVSWDQVPAQAHVEIDFDRLRPWRKADASFFAG